MPKEFKSLIKQHHLESLTGSSDLVPLPIALADETLTQIWENKYLKKHYPFLCSPDNIRSLLQGYHIDSLLLSLRGQDSSFSCPSRLPLVHTVLTFSPLYDTNRVFIGATVHFSVSSTEMFPSDVNRTQEMLQNFNTSLRDPLSSIFSSISTMARRLEVDDTASCEELLQQLNQYCYHMLKSCNSLSEYTAYSNGLSMLNLKLVSLNPYLEELFEHLQMFARRAGVQLTYTLPKESIELNLDTDKLVIVLTSLISNSIAFMEESAGEKKIHLKIDTSKKFVRFAVSDNGVGIPASLLPYIFEPYFTSGRKDLHFSHLGLGLTISKMIVSHHGGEISAFSAEGSGSVVTFTLSRALQNDQQGQLTFCDNPIDYIVNSYSPMYIYLSDVCEWLNP